jgi:hypothetical protein
MIAWSDATARPNPPIERQAAMKGLMDRPEKAMVNAGLIFIFTVWLQGQMSDLILLKNNPDLVADFEASPEKIPASYQKLRVSYWEQQFGDVKKEFVKAFSGQLEEQDLKDIEQIYHFRNMIGHAHVSVGRDYMLYRPGTSRKEPEVLAAFDPEPVADQSDPVLIKLSFWRPEVFKSLSDQIERLDQVCFARLAKTLRVSHGRIR